MKIHQKLTISLRYDLYRRLRRIAKNENTSIEDVAEGMLVYQLEQRGRSRALPPKPERAGKILLDDFELGEPYKGRDSECEGCQ